MITTSVVDCSCKNANYYRSQPYRIPRLELWLTYHHTCLAGKFDIGFMSYQFYWHLPKFVSKVTTKFYKGHSV